MGVRICGGYGVKRYRKSGRIRNRLRIENNNFVVHLHLHMRSIFRYVTSHGYCFFVLYPILVLRTLITLVSVAQGTEALTHHVN